VLGRYVPGVRFAVNSLMGMRRYPYRKFLLWSVIGGASWSAYTAGLAYRVSTSLSDYPLASVVISGVITTLCIGSLFVYMRRKRAAAGASDAASPAGGAG
jgi:membrane protein DedA with SNARE-associated domain